MLIEFVPRRKDLTLCPTCLNIWSAHQPVVDIGETILSFDFHLEAGLLYLAGESGAVRQATLTPAAAVRGGVQELQHKLRCRPAGADALIMLIYHALFTQCHLYAYK